MVRVQVSKCNTAPIPQHTPGQKHMVLPIPLSFPIDLLNMSTKLWYSSGSALRSRGVEEVDWPVTSGREIMSWKCWVPSSLQMCAYAKALMRVTHGGFLLFTSGEESEVSWLIIYGLDRGADDGKVSTGGDVLASGCDRWWKKMRVRYIIPLLSMQQWCLSFILYE